MSEVFNTREWFKDRMFNVPLYNGSHNSARTSAIQCNTVTCVRAVTVLRDSIQTDVISILLVPPAADGKPGLLPLCSVVAL